MAQPQIIVEDDRTGMHPETFERAVLDHLYYSRSKDLRTATPLDVYGALSLAVRDRLVHRWIRTQRTYYEKDAKRAYYLSAEFLLGRFLGDNLIKLGLIDIAKGAIARYRMTLEEVIAQEPDPGLGNGGLGRLAACFLDSMATLELPGYGYGIRYEFGIFEQEIAHGWQHEVPDEWARFGNLWEIERPEYTVPVQLYGRVVHGHDERGRFTARWIDGSHVLGVPCDMPIAGWGNDTVNTLRLWSARASKELNLAVFNAGDYRSAVEEKALSESISKVLYPNDHSPQGKELRLKQQYFFVACSIADILRRFDKVHERIEDLPNKAAIQLNDTHPAIGIAELMRVLVDERGLAWEPAWEITRACMGYTNHTLLTEALERWPVGLIGHLLPRHLEIIYEINARFLREVEARWPRQPDKLERMSIIDETHGKQVRMGHLAAVGSHAINGVAALHSRLVKEQLFPEFAEMWPERFQNKTNGVTPRRWMAWANPGLSELLRETLGDRWMRDLSSLRGLLRFEKDAAFLERLRLIKRTNKERTAALIERSAGVAVDPSSMLDTLVKRIHEYKRQLLDVMHVIWRYLELKDRPNADLFVPRTVVFAGKAAPGYAMAKLIIKLVHDVASVVNADPKTRDWLRVAFVPNYSVSVAEVLIPGTELSEQISTAGKEASGTGNMKFAMNGALTIGTLDGANVEIREEVGAASFFLFGLSADEVAALDRDGYHPGRFIAKSDRLRRVLDALGRGVFSPDEPGRFGVIVHELTNRDTYKHCADFDAYVDRQLEVDRTYRDPAEWTRRALRNIACSGKFSSDRTIREYAEEIWGIEPAPVSLERWVD